MRKVSALAFTIVFLSLTQSSQAAEHELFTGKQPFLQSLRNGKSASIVGSTIAHNRNVLALFVTGSGIAGRRFAINTTVAQVRTLSISAGGRAVVSGFASGDLDAVTVVDLTTGHVIADFLCYKAAVSPSAAYIAYVQYFNPHVSDMALSTNVYKVVRVDGLEQKLQFSAPGETVYPVTRPSASLEEYHALYGPIRWLHDNAFAFTDDFRREDFAIVVGLSGAKWKVISVRSLGTPNFGEPR